MAQVAGFTVERTLKGRPTMAHIDLRKHSFFIPIFEEHGFFVEPEKKWTAKTKRAFAESENGGTVLGDIKNFWNI